jgi:hypothetical protein
MDLQNEVRGRMLSMLRRPLSSTLLIALAVTFAGASDAASITGVCPDGSIFVVRDPASIPCRGARRVEPHQVPPMRPENLSRSYLWDVYNEKRNENNPYNLVDRANKVRESLGKGGAAPPPEAMQPGDGAALPHVASAPPTSAAAVPVPRSEPQASGEVHQASQLDLTDGELRDLFYLVELSQEQAPATFATQAANGGEAMRVSFAHSQAFESRVKSAASVDGRVVLWSAQPRQRESFRPNFTFVQGQTSFHPQAGDPQQFGVLVGRIGDLDKDDLVLGYAVLPDTIDLARPVDLYWDDRRLAVTFQR